MAKTLRSLFRAGLSAFDSSETLDNFDFSLEVVKTLRRELETANTVIGELREEIERLRKLCQQRFDTILELEDLLDHRLDANSKLEEELEYWKKREREAAASGRLVSPWDREIRFYYTGGDSASEFHAIYVDGEEVARLHVGGGVPGVWIEPKGEE